MGKTTLAKLVFNDPRINNFDLKVWVFTPNKFVMRIVLENIIESATGESCSHFNMETLKRTLCHIVHDQRFLLVLDNVYIQDSNEWLDLMELLEKFSKRGLFVMVTTREDRVAFITGTMESYKLKPLSDDHCWSIFVNCAFKEGEEDAYPWLVRIGKNIVRKSCGVPLAAKTLGCQLRTVRDERTWRCIEESELWKIEQEPSGILPSLKLSYDQLPYYIRPCFSFCSALPKGAFLFKEDVINQWMALGLLQSESVAEPPEEIGSKYFNELLSRSFFETVNPLSVVDHLGEHRNFVLKSYPTDILEMWQEVMYKLCYEKRCVQMHDLVHDLATYVAGEETPFVSCNTNDVSSVVGHLVWEEEEHSEKRGFPFQLQAAKKARSLLFQDRRSRCMSKSFLKGLVSSFQCLRILSLNDFEFEDLPDSVGDLKYLK